MKNNEEIISIVPALNSNLSTVKTDSLCIKLGIIMKEKDNAPKCRHFSIRGYVAGMREKGNSNLLPFTEELPPMDIPNFRYWLCLQNNETADTSTEKCHQCVFSPSQQNLNVLPFGEGTSGLKQPVDGKNNDETILAALEVDESQSCSEILDKVKVSHELIKHCSTDTNAAKKESNDMKDHEKVPKRSIVTDSQPLDQCGQHMDNYQNGHPRRKTRKVRLLKELLCRNTAIRHQKKYNTHSLPSPHVKRKKLLDHPDHDQDSKKAKTLKGDAVAKNNLVEALEIGENNKYEWNKNGLIHGKTGSDAIFSDMGKTTDNCAPPPTYSVAKSRGTGPCPSFMNPIKSDKRVNSSKKTSSNRIIKTNIFVEDSRRMMDDSRLDTDIGLNLSLKYDSQSHIRSQPSILNRPLNQDYMRKSGFFTHMIQSDSESSKEFRPVHEKPQLPYGMSCSGHHKLDVSDPYKRNKIEGVGELIRPTNQQRQETVFSVGRSDEREIIKLMAKNQHERNLCEVNNGGIFHKLMNEGMTSSRYDYLNMIRPPSYSIATSESVGPMRNPAGGFFHQDRVSSFTTRPLNGVWMSHTGPQRHYDSLYPYASNVNNKRLQTNLYYPSNTHALEAFNNYNNGTRQHEQANMQFGQTSAKYCDKDKAKNLMDLDLNLVAEEQNNFESLDLNPNSYSNETIPAMQLLSLMDAGKLNQPFSVTKPKQKPISYFISHCSSTVTEITNPMVNPTGSSYSRAFRTGQNVKLTRFCHGQQEVMKSRGSSLASVGCRPEDSYVFPHPCQSSGGQNKLVNKTFGPGIDPSRTEICTINRNPADFSTPGPENVYMINVQDLVFNGNGMKPTS